MRLLIAVLAALSLAGCATGEFSSLEDTNDPAKSKLIVGDAETVKVAIIQAITTEYPDDKLHAYPDGIFMWSHIESGAEVDFRLQLFAGTGLDDHKKPILGLFYTVNANESPSVYMPSLRRAVDDALESRGVKTVKVKLLSTLTLLKEGEKLAEQSKDCFSHVNDDPAVAVLKSKLDFEDGNSTFAMMTDTGKPTSEERRAILRWGQLRESCLSLENKANKWIGIPSQLDAERNSLITNQQALIAQLYMGNLTYAKFASAMQGVTNTYKEQSARVSAELKKNADEQRDRERQIDATIRSSPGSTVGSSMVCNYGGGMMFCY